MRAILANGPRCLPHVPSSRLSWRCRRRSRGHSRRRRRRPAAAPGRTRVARARAAARAARPRSVSTRRRRGRARAGTGGRPPADTREQGAIFLRADRLEGTREWIEASGKVELRTRRETVLADWLALRRRDRRGQGKGNVMLRRHRRISGPEVSSSAARDRLLRPPQLLHRREGVARRGGGDPLRGPRSLRGPDAAAYTTCVAPQRRLVPARGEIEIDTRARSAPRMMRGSTSWACRCSTRRGSSFRCRTSASPGFSRRLRLDARPRPRNVAPVLFQPRAELRRDADVAAHDAPRPPGQRAVPLSVRPTLPASRRRGPAATASPTPRAGLSWTTQRAVRFARGSPATSTATGVGRHVLRGLLRPRGDHLADDAAAGGRARRPCGPFSMLARVQAFQTLQDPNEPITPPYIPLPQVLATLNRDRMARLHVLRHRRIRAFRQPSLVDRQSLADLSVGRAGPRRATPGSSRRARPIPPRQYDLNDPTAAGRRTADRGGADREPRRRARVRARLECLRHATSCRRSSRAPLRLHPVSRPEPASRVRHGDRRLQFLAALHARTATSAVIASATPTSSRSPSTSRLLDPVSGAERFRVAVGQRFYFEDQRVTLGRGAAGGLVGLSRGRGGTPVRRMVADRPRAVRLRQSQIERFNIGARWNPEPGKVISCELSLLAGTRRPRRAVTQLKQSTCRPSGRSPTTGRFSGAGTTRWSTARRWRRSRAWSTMAAAGHCASWYSG